MKAVKFAIRQAIFSVQKIFPVQLKARLLPADKRILMDFDLQRDIAPRLIEIQQYLDSRSRDILSRISIVLVNPLPSHMVELGVRILGCIETGDFEGFNDLINESSRKYPDVGWRTMHAVQLMIESQFNSIYAYPHLSAAQEAEAEAKKKLLVLYDWLTRNWSGTEREITVLSSIFYSLLEPRETAGLQVQALTYDGKPENRLAYETYVFAQKLKAQNLELYLKTKKIYEDYLFDHIITLERNVKQLAQAAKASHGNFSHSVSGGTAALSKDFLFASYDEAGRLLGYQVAKTGLRRNTIFVAKDFWMKIRENPLALAQFIAHETAHLDQQNPVLAGFTDKDRIAAEEKLAEAKEKEVFENYSLDKQGQKFPPQLKNYLPSLDDNLIELQDSPK